MRRLYSTAPANVIAINYVRNTVKIAGDDRWRAWVDSDAPLPFHGDRVSITEDGFACSYAEPPSAEAHCATFGPVEKTLADHGLLVTGWETRRPARYEHPELRSNWMTRDGRTRVTVVSDPRYR